MVTFARPNLDRQVDPKLAWALSHREQLPVDVNTAPREMLLRIPGLGKRTVDRILQTRQERAVASADLRNLRVPWHQLRYFVVTSDHCPPRTRERADRPSLFGSDDSPRQRNLFSM